MIGYLKTCMSQITAGNICVFNTFHSTTLILCKYTNTLILGRSAYPHVNDSIMLTLLIYCIKIYIKTNNTLLFNIFKLTVANITRLKKKNYFKFFE